MVKNLPEQAQKNVKALKNVQLEHLKLEAKFFQEVYQLEKKYHLLYQPLLDKRKDIVIGAYVPTEAESKWEDPEEEDEEVAAKLKKISLEINKHKPPTKYSADLKGIPDFWLTVFKNTELLADMIQEHDEPILKKLTDITVTYSDNPMSYILTFHFDSNEYFTDSVLTKQYFLRSTVEESEPFAFEGPEIHKCTVSFSFLFAFLKVFITFFIFYFLRDALSTGIRERISPSKQLRRSKSIRLVVLSEQLLNKCPMIHSSISLLHQKFQKTKER